MRLLLTRAAADAARTGAKLLEAGHEVVYSPVIEMVATKSPWPIGAVDGVVASSAQAFSILGADPMPEARRVMPLWLVGDRTATVARQVGFDGAIIVADSASNLIAAVRNERRPRRLLYLAGEDRKPDLEEGLAGLGLHLEMLVVYRARSANALEPSARKALDDGTIDAVLHFSRRSASLFCRLAPASLARSPDHYVISEDAAVPLRDAGFATIRVTEAPTEAALLTLIRSSTS